MSSIWSPGFVEELLPCSQQISLLYHISYLCLAKFPKLERLLMMRAVETQLLFGSSEAVMLKCVSTSQNFVSAMFPMLTLAIETNKPVEAVKYLEKARDWIREIFLDVEKMVEKYEAHNKDLEITTRNVVTAKKNMNMKLSKIQIQHDSIPEPIHLGKIQGNFLQLTSFWENVYSMLGSLKDRMFICEDFVEEPELKDEILESIQTASRVWEKFSHGCSKAVKIFRVQNKDAYKFLEIDPDTLTPDEWQKEYDMVLETLKQIKVHDEATAGAKI